APRGGPLALAAALLAAALLAALAAGIAIGKFGAGGAPPPAPRAALTQEPQPETPPGLKLDRDLEAFAARAAALQEKK
ncbi:MAG TPA: hypothetical protein VKA16_01285, partial [Burkholderiales bacterium]|nr:hypothetical protein [Burkholderiales bacterium]